MDPWAVWDIFLNPQPAFRVHKTSQISKIAFRRNLRNGQRTKPIKSIASNQVSSSLDQPQFGSDFVKIEALACYQQLRLFFFFAKIWKQLGNRIHGGIFQHHMVIQLTMARLFLRTLNASTEHALHPVYDHLVYVNGNQTDSCLATTSSQEEAAITVNKPGGIGVIDFCWHTLIVYHASISNKLQSPTELSLSDIQDVNTVLLRNKAMKFTSGIEGEDRFGTGPIAASYLGLGHTDLLNSLTNISQFIASHQYSNVTPVLPAEVGYCNYFRFCLSAEGLIEANASSTGQDVYDMFMVAREAVGDVELSGYGVQLIYSDPSIVEPRFRTASSLACKWSQAPTILNDAWIIRLRSTL